MNIFDRIFKRSKNNFPFNVSFNSQGFTSGEGNSTAIACTNLICSAIAAMPLDVYINNQKSKFHYLHPLLHTEPNRDETIDLFLKLIVKDYLKGNIYLYIYRDESGIPISLFRLNPDEVRVSRDSSNNKIFTIGSNAYDFKQVLHIPSHMGYDGLVGKSIYSIGKSVFDLSKKMEDYLIYGLDNSLGKRLVIDITRAYPDATPDQISAIRNQFTSTYTGAANSGKPLIKAKNILFESMDSGTADNRSAQLSELRAMQDFEICKLFGVPVNFIGDKYSGEIEGLYMLFIDNAIRPIAEAIAKGLGKILYPVERETTRIEFNYNSILKTSIESRINAYTKQFASGILSINEIRAKENLAPLDEGGSTHFVPVNLMPLTEDNIAAYMASSKLKIQEAPGIGSDKL